MEKTAEEGLRLTELATLIDGYDILAAMQYPVSSAISLDELLPKF